MKDSLTSTKSFFLRLDDKMVEFKKRNMDLRKRIEHLERYSRDFNNRVIGVDQDEGEECMALVLNILTLLGFEDA